MSYLITKCTRFTQLHFSSYILGYIEGDILLTPEQQRFMEATANPSNINTTQNAAVRFQQSIWQGGVVPYILDNLNSKKYY